MNKQVTDMEAIRKYYNGELDSAAMHELEKNALQNPFLQDAMDGFEEFAFDEADLNDLSALISQRIDEDKKLVPFIQRFKYWGIAASLLLGIVALSVFLNQSPDKNNIALNQVQQSKNPSSVIKPETEDIANNDKEKSITHVTEESSSVIINNNKIKKQPENEDEVATMQMQSMETVKNENSDPFNQENLSVTDEPKMMNEVLANRVAGVALANRAKLSANKTMIDKDFSSVKGRITDAESGRVIPGVFIKDEKGGATTQTNVNGEFQMRLKAETGLKLSFLGYEQKVVPVKLDDSVNVSLELQESNISELVVNGNSAKNGTITAGPNNGWASFKKYLDDNAKLEIPTEGKVVVNFEIAKDGSLSNFKIIESLNKKADEKALLLIKNYKNGWHGTSDGLPQKKTVTITFKKR